MTGGRHHMVAHLNLGFNHLSWWSPDSWLYLKIQVYMGTWLYHIIPRLWSFSWREIMTNIKCWGIRFYISRQTQQACCLTLTAEIGVRSLMIIVVARNANSGQQRALASYVSNRCARTQQSRFSPQNSIMPLWCRSVKRGTICICLFVVMWLFLYFNFSNKDIDLILIYVKLVYIYDLYESSNFIQFWLSHSGPITSNPAVLIFMRPGRSKMADLKQLIMAKLQAWGPRSESRMEYV